MNFIKRNTKQFLNSEFIGVIFFLAIYLGYYLIKTQRDNNWTNSRIEKKYSKNIALVKHEFAIKLVFNNPKEEPLYFVKSKEGNFFQWKKGIPGNVIVGAGFVINQSGDCITSANLAYPIPRNESLDFLALRKEVKIFRDIFNINSAGYYEIFTIKLGYYPFGSYLADSSSFIECSGDGYFDGGVHLLKTKTPMTPDRDIVSFTWPQYKSQSIKEDRYFVLGLPNTQLTEEKVQALGVQVNLDSIVRKSDIKNFTDKGWSELYFSLPSFFIMEGAIVFNQKGNIAGVMSVTENKYKAFSTKLERIK